MINYSFYLRYKPYTINKMDSKFNDNLVPLNIDFPKNEVTSPTLNYDKHSDEKSQLKTY